MDEEIHDKECATSYKLWSPHDGKPGLQEAAYTLSLPRDMTKYVWDSANKACHTRMQTIPRMKRAR